MSNIVTVNNVKELDYTSLVTLLHEIYTRELPEVNINKPLDRSELERLIAFFSNQYAYMIELEAVMAHEVRLLKRTSKNKDVIDEAMGARDYLDKVASACKLKAHACNSLYKGVLYE